MSTRAVVVVHRETMVAEGIASALSNYTGIVPIGSATTASEGALLGERADAVALDVHLPGAEVAADRLRRHGVRVVFLGSGGRAEGVGVSTRDPIAVLASALVPGARSARPPARGLTPREQEILDLVAEGLAAKQVARHLGISPKTVEQHKSKIFTKLGVPNQAAAVSVAIKDRVGRRTAWSLSTT
jgi:DNA-binding NarL/FixJ family response regulator